MQYFFSEISFYYFLLLSHTLFSHDVKNIVWDKTFEEEFLMELHVLRSCESEIHVYIIWSACVWFFFNTTRKEVIVRRSNLVL